MHKHMKAAKQKQNIHADKGGRDVNQQVCDLVFVKNHRQTNKIKNNFYKRIEQAGQLSLG